MWYTCSTVMLYRYDRIETHYHVWLWNRRKGFLSAFPYYLRLSMWNTSNLYYQGRVLVLHTYCVFTVFMYIHVCSVALGAMTSRTIRVLGLCLYSATCLPIPTCRNTEPPSTTHPTSSSATTTLTRRTVWPTTLPPPTSLRR